MNTKDRVLRALEENKGSFISGEELAKVIGVSRNSVWKAVHELKERGYSIESVTNRGYSLSKSCDIISVQGIAAFLYNKEDAANIEVYNEITSTSQLAKERAVMEALDKRVIIAKKQTAGKGHGRKRFESPEGGIYFSIFLSPESLKQENLPLYAAVAVADSLEKTKAPIRIKWINDIYLEDKKICGILTEIISDLETGEISSYIIGIGINCETDNKNELIADILNRLFYPEIYYKDKEITKLYQNKLMYMNKKVRFVINGEESDDFSAVIKGMDDSGNLIVEKSDGTKVHMKKGYIII